MKMSRRSSHFRTMFQPCRPLCEGFRPASGTSIYDAVLLGAKALELRGEDRRRVIILVTDAGETTSPADFEAARKEAVRSDALLYTIVIRPMKNESGRNTAGEHALTTITETTGGDMFFPDTPQELDVIFDLIDRELRTQYRLALLPYAARACQYVSQNRSQSSERRLSCSFAQDVSYRTAMSPRSCQSSS